MEKGGLPSNKREMAAFLRKAARLKLEEGDVLPENSEEILGKHPGCSLNGEVVARTTWSWSLPTSKGTFGPLTKSVPRSKQECFCNRCFSSINETAYREKFKNNT